MSNEDKKALVINTPTEDNATSQDDDDDVVILESHSPSSSGLSTVSSERTKLIVNYLPQSFSDSDLFQLFVSIGPIASCHVHREKQSGYSFGFGFVEFEDEDDAAKAIDVHELNNAHVILSMTTVLQRILNGFEVQKKRLKVSHARPLSTDTRDTNLYVSNLPPETTSEDLNTLFSPYGSIVNVTVLEDATTGMCRGSGFVLMAERAQASKAMKALNNVSVKGSKLSVSVANNYKEKTLHYIRFIEKIEHQQFDDYNYTAPRGYGCSNDRRGRHRHHPFNRLGKRDDN